MSIEKTITVYAAYSAGGSLSKNSVQKVDIRTQEQIDVDDDPIIELRYKVSITLNAESAEGSNDTMVKKPSVRAYLKDRVNSENDYLLSMWSVADLARALPQAILDADLEIKTLYGTGAPAARTATTTII